MIWKNRRRTLDLTHRAEVMGVLNVTPDSFSDGGSHIVLERALAHAREMIAAGVGIIDIGGESTRPGAFPVSAEQEMERTLPIIAALRHEWDGLISVDTMKSAVAAAAITAGADIVNDVSGLLADVEMPRICAESGCGVVVMHRQGTPQTMQLAPCYEDVLGEVRAYFQGRLETLTAAGIQPEAMCFDPGIGFGKTLAHNLTLLRGLGEMSVAGRPILLGVSRKSFIGKLLETHDLSMRDWPTVAITARAREQGIRLHRVHSVRGNVEALRMVEAILGQAEVSENTSLTHLL